MGRIEVRQIPKELHPAGESLLKIFYGPEEPPKDYIWVKGEDDCWLWNGKKWVPYEFEYIKDKGCNQKDSCYVTDEEMAAKFAKFKEDVLAAVLRMNKTQDATNIADIRNQIAQLNVIIHQLEEFENYYTKDQVDEKTTALTNITTALNNSINGLSRRLIGLETNLSDILPTIVRLNAIDHTQFITARDVSEVDPGDYTIDILDGYATEDYVDRAIARVVGTAPQALDTLKELGDALGNDADFAATITTALANKADKSEIPEEYDDTELVGRIETLENNPITDPSIITRIETLEDRPIADQTLTTRVQALENKPFDQYLTNEDGLVISTSLNDLNTRVNNVQSQVDNLPLDQYLTETDELVIASGMNNLNDRVSRLEIESESSN